MPIINANVSDDAYKAIMDTVEGQEKKNKSAVITALIMQGSVMLQYEVQKRVAEFEAKQKIDRKEAVLRLIKLGYAYSQLLQEKSVDNEQ